MLSLASRVELFLRAVSVLPCAFFGMGGDEISNSDDSIVFVNNSNIQYGWESEGNTDIDPLFVQSVYWIDANDPNNPVAFEPFPKTAALLIWTPTVVRRKPANPHRL